MYTPIELDKTRNLRYGMLAISLIEDSLKTNIAKLDFENLTMKETATVIWAGLAHEDKDLDPVKVMMLIDDNSDFITAAEAMGDALEKAFGKGEGSKGKNRQRASKQKSLA